MQQNVSPFNSGAVGQIGDVIDDLQLLVFHNMQIETG